MDKTPKIPFGQWSLLNLNNSGRISVVIESSSGDSGTWFRTQGMKYFSSWSSDVVNGVDDAEMNKKLKKF